MVNSYIKSLKLAKHLILTIPSNNPASLQPAEKPFNQNCFANQLSSFYTSFKIAENTKLATINTTCKNIQKTT